MPPCEFSLQCFGTFVTCEYATDALSCSVAFIQTLKYPKIPPLPRSEHQCNNHTFLTIELNIKCTPRHRCRSCVLFTNEQIISHKQGTANVVLSNLAFHSCTTTAEPANSITHTTPCKNHYPANPANPCHPCHLPALHQRDRRGCCVTTRAWGR